MAFSYQTPRHFVKVTLHSPPSLWQCVERETKGVCLPVQTAHWRLFLDYFLHALIVRHCWLDVPLHYLTSGIVSIQTCNQTFSQKEQVHTVRFAFSFFFLFFFATIFEVISTFFGLLFPCLTAPFPSLSKVLAAWRIVWTCMDPMWDYS